MENYLAQRRKELNLTQKQIAQAVGVSEGTVSRWESGSIANMRRDRILRYATILKTTPESIMSGKKQPIPPGFEPIPEMSTLPRIGRIACGSPVLAQENIEAYDQVPALWRADFTLLCTGDSMLPRIQDGDLVAIRRQPTVENGEIAAVRIEEEATLKRVYTYADRLVLQPENPAFAPIVLVGEEMNCVQIEGKAVGLCRGL